MYPPPPGQQHAGLTPTPSRGGVVTRRRLIAAAALIAGVGITDAACEATRKGQAALRSAGVGGGGGHHHHGRAAKAHGRQRGPTHTTHHASALPNEPIKVTVEHHGKHIVERVQLPHARTRVRTRPAYYVDEVVSHPPKHVIGLTIDDGPDPQWTPKVLRLLDKYRMHATFCVVGIHADAYPRLIRDIHRAGHTIVNHSYTHIQPFATQSEPRIVTEITRTQRSIERATKFTPELFRSPGGDWSTFLFRACAAYDLLPLDWDVDPLDWSMPGTKKIQRAMLSAKPNDIVLCHDGGGNRSETVRALRKVLPAYKHRGYTVIPLIPNHGVTPPPSPSPTPTTSSSPTSSASPSLTASPTSSS